MGGGGRFWASFCFCFPDTPTPPQKPPTAAKRNLNKIDFLKIECYYTKYHENGGNDNGLSLYSQ